MTNGPDPYESDFLIFIHHRSKFGGIVPDGVLWIDGVPTMLAT